MGSLMCEPACAARIRPAATSARERYHSPSMPKPESSLVSAPVVMPIDAADGALPLIDLPASRPRDARPGISDASPQELLSWFSDHGEAAFRARQLADHVWSGRARSFADIHTLPGPLREALGQAYRYCTLTDTERRLDGQGAPYAR